MKLKKMIEEIGDYNLILMLIGITTYAAGIVFDDVFYTVAGLSVVTIVCMKIYYERITERLKRIGEKLDDIEREEYDGPWKG